MILSYIFVYSIHFMLRYPIEQHNSLNAVAAKQWYLISHPSSHYHPVDMVPFRRADARICRKYKYRVKKVKRVAFACQSPGYRKSPLNRGTGSN